MNQVAICCLLPIACLWLGDLVAANPDAKRLYEDVLMKRDYNSLIRPVSNHSDTLTVYVGLKLAQLIDIDEKNQIMTTNVWVQMIWKEPRLRWNSDAYGGIKQLMIPSSDLWLPDVVLFNNADGNYEVNKETKAVLHSSGMVMWEPPARFKSSCQIDVEFFPFDKQLCAMKFGSWTYDGLQVDLRHVSQTNSSAPVVEHGIDLDGMHESTEWDVLQVPARRNQKTYPCCPEPYPDITFTIVMRRKTLFYTVNLIFPCVAISFLSLFVFYLPSDSGEKTTLCISVLLAVTFFFLVVAESIPPTSLVVPLIGKYLLFTMVIVTLSIIITVIEMNFNVRTPSTNKMSPWTRKIFLVVLPKLLRIKRPRTFRYDLLQTDDGVGKTTGPTGASAAAAAASRDDTRGDESVSESSSWRLLRRPGRQLSREQLAPQLHQPAAEDTLDAGEQHAAVLRRRIVRDMESLLRANGAQQRASENGSRNPSQDLQPDQEETWQLRPEFARAGCRGLGADDPASDPRIRREIRGALSSVQFIAKHMRSNLVEKREIDDWKFITHVMDSLFMLLFSVICTLGTIIMFLQAPSLYDRTLPIDTNNMAYKNLVKLD